MVRGIWKVGRAGLSTWSRGTWKTGKDGCVIVERRKEAHDRRAYVQKGEN